MGVQLRMICAIEALNERDMQAARAGDITTMMSQWTDDFVLLPPAGPIMRGRAAIAEAFQGVENPGITEYVLDVQEVKVGGRTTTSSNRPQAAWRSALAARSCGFFSDSRTGLGKCIAA